MTTEIPARPHVRRRQSVLLAGETNTTKTGFLLRIAEDNPQLPFYFLDTQNRVRDIAEGVTKHGTIPENVTLGIVDEYDTETHAMQQCLEFVTDTVMPAAKEGPGVYMIDMVDNIWGWAQDFYVFTKTGVHQHELDQKGKVDFNPGIDEQHAWQRIKNWHRTCTYAIINSPRFDHWHTLFTAPVRDVRKNDSERGKNPLEDKDKSLVGTWKPFGNVLPDAEKRFTYEVLTAIGIDFVVNTDMSKKMRLTLVKDRKLFRGEEMNLEQYKRMNVLSDEPGMLNIWKTYTENRGLPYELDILG